MNALDLEPRAPRANTHETVAPLARFARMPGLDGLRGVAILMVLCHDYNLLEDPASTAGRLGGLLLNAGWLGVQLFFVLSGFLITGILLDTREDSNYYGRFFGRRVRRIFPLYYAALLVAFVAMPLLSRSLPGSQHQLWYWLFAANWSEVFGKSVATLPHLWSLSVEEQFYFVWPFVVRKMKPKSVAVLCLAIVVAAPLSRIVFRAAISPDAAYMFTICRADALALGALAAVAIREPLQRRFLFGHRALLRWYGVAILVVTVFMTKGASRTNILSQSYGYSLFAVAFTMLVVAAAPMTDADDKIELSRPLQTIGKYSYAMYVFHIPIHLVIGAPLVAKLTGETATGTHGIPFALGYLVCATALTFGLAYVSFHALEKHFTMTKPRRA